MLHGGDPQFRPYERHDSQPAGARREPHGLPFTSWITTALPRASGASSSATLPCSTRRRGRRSLLTEGAWSSRTSSRRGSGPLLSPGPGRLPSSSTATPQTGSASTGRAGSPLTARVTPQERREIEGRLFRGDLLGVVSTNALELGVDVGALDAVVCCGYPGSVASIWQQWGRAGRGKDPALAVYIPGRDSLDQFLFENPPRVLGRRVEAARVTMENPTSSARTCSPPPTRPRSTRTTRSTSGRPTGAWRRR